MRLSPCRSCPCTAWCPPGELYTRSAAPVGAAPPEQTETWQAPFQPWSGTLTSHCKPGLAASDQLCEVDAYSCTITCAARPLTHSFLLLHRPTSTWVALLTEPKHPQPPALFHGHCTTPSPTVCCRLHLSSGTLFALLADGTIHVWEVATGKDPVLLEVWDHPTPNNRDRVSSCCFMSGEDLSPRLADFQGERVAGTWDTVVLRKPKGVALGPGGPPAKLVTACLLRLEKRPRS